MSQEFERQGVRAHPGRGRRAERHGDTHEERLERSRQFIARHIDAEDVVEVSARLDKLMLLYSDIHAKVGHLDVMYYPAGSADVFPILLADNLVIVDKAHLFNEEKPRSAATRRTIVRANKALAMHQIATGTYGADAQEALRVAEVEMHVQSNLVLNQVIRMGFETFGKEEERGEDNFAHIMANLGILGVDLPEVTIRKLPGCYRISFPFEGTIKHIYYVTEEFPEISESTREMRIAKARSVQERVQPFIGSVERTGVMKKADLLSVTDGFIGLEPEAIVMDTKRSVPENLEDTYELYELSDEERYLPLRRFGYKSQSDPRIDVQIALKR